MKKNEREIQRLEHTAETYEKKGKESGHMRKMGKEGNITDMRGRRLNVQIGLDIWQMKEKSLNSNLIIYIGR